MNRLVVSFLVVSALLSAQAQRGALMQKFLEKRLSKNATETTGPAPDYSDLYFWAASPHKLDSSDYIPPFLKNKKQIDRDVDLFFIHPTSDTKELKTAAWNANLQDEAINKETDSRAIKFQASVFNEKCRVFAPRYRQASLKVFVVRESDRAKQALELAYSDVKNAFDYYLKYENNGRPIIIASHSQGSLHAIRLLQHYFDGKELQKKLVCAYIIGYHIPKDAFKNIPLGESASQTGCYVGWRTYQKGEITADVKSENGNSVCVNPLSWTTTTDIISPKETPVSDLSRINVLNAQIEPNYKVLWVTLPFNAPGNVRKMKNLHVLDYTLFWMSIRENVKMRIDSYFEMI